MRIASYNVHMWMTPTLSSNVRPVIKVLQELNADIVGLEEVDSAGPTNSGETDTDRVARNLTAAVVNGHAGFDSLGNAIISRQPVVDRQGLKLSDMRTMVLGTVQVPAGPNGEAPRPLTVCCVHLDHIYEGRRTKQLGAALDWLEGLKLGPHIIVGDFNSVRVEDYDDRSFAEMARKRKESDWEEPRGEVVQMMDRAGYVDAYRLELVKASHPQGPFVFSWEEYTASLTDNRFRHPAPEFHTCWVGTRIDYIWLSRGLMDQVDFVRYHRGTSNASDHFPVACDLEWKK